MCLFSFFLIIIKSLAHKQGYRIIKKRFKILNKIPNQVSVKIRSQN